ncbi:hypothetical protein [Methanohalophilus profundi]|nr:hypothetical protein [Methanohalophilus profundi]
MFHLLLNAILDIDIAVTMLMKMKDLDGMTKERAEVIVSTIATDGVIG